MKVLLTSCLLENSVALSVVVVILTDKLTLSNLARFSQMTSVRDPCDRPCRVGGRMSTRSRLIPLRHLELRVPPAVTAATVRLGPSNRVSLP